MHTCARRTGCNQQWVREQALLGRDGARTAIGGGGLFGNNAYQFPSGLFCEEASVGIARVGTHASSSAMSAARRSNPDSRSKKLTAELDLPLETLPKTTCEFTSVKSRRVCIPS